ncbi:centromere protein C [Trifolium repens]|nr:centromere protein C [Trifolium repens]
MVDNSRHPRINANADSNFNSVILLELNLCLLIQEKRVGYVAPVNRLKRIKSCTQKESKGKRFQQRKSLADSGTSFESKHQVQNGVWSC